MIKVDQVKVNIDYTQSDLIKKCSKILKVHPNDIVECEILKQSIDARKKPEIYYVFSLIVSLKNNLESRFAKLSYVKPDYNLTYSKKSLAIRPVVVGFGPSGMFSALCLAKMGLKPIIVEQGKQVDEREKDVLEFWNNRKLNKYSNVQFGEGGAGTFSDGKLNSNVTNFQCKQAMWEMFKAGAPKEILYQAKPHIGSDKLKDMVKNIRNQIIELGGEFKFSHKLIDFEVKDNVVTNVIIQNVLDDTIYSIPTNHLLLCVGHSAKDVFELLYKKQVRLAQKPFAMGVRIEQSQETINISQYGKGYNKLLPNADYKLVAHLANGRSIFTFCMCPGGEVVASSSEENTIVTNGMSNFARDKQNANSAVLINVNPADFGSDHPLAGVYFQSKYEHLAFEIGGKNYNAPAQTVGEFLGNNNKAIVNPSYRPGITYTNIKDCLPDFVYESLKLGLPILNQKIKDFANSGNLLIAIESRSSCPLTIIRDENMQTNIKGLYPVGEGAGYSGGIITSAQDGIKVAESIYNSL